MTPKWTAVQLGEVLVRAQGWVDIQPGGRYREVTVRLWGKGVVMRREVNGSEVIEPKRRVVRANQFIVSRIDARNGACGIVPESLDQAIVSSDFPTFTPDPAKVDPGFLGWMSKTPAFVSLCRDASEGTTNRVRLKEGRFMASRVLLPPLREQQRIVARIEELAARIEEVRRLKQEEEETYNVLCRSVLFDERDGLLIPTPMRELVRMREPNVTVSTDETYHFAGVYCFGRGVFKGQSRSGTSFSYTRLTRLRAGDFVYPKLMAWEGALGIVPPECDGLVVSPEFPVFEVDTRRVLPDTLDVYFRTPSVWPILSNISTGTNVRRRRLQPSNFLQLKIPLPPMHIQQRSRDLKIQVDELKQLQGQTAAEINALLPSILNKAFNGEL